LALRLEDRWVWDFWLAAKGDEHHLFFLHAPRSLGEPDLRHVHARIGHAVSTDLANWEILPSPFPTGPLGAWDDVATWTGSVIEHAGTWFMFYTGVSSRERNLIQRIGVATSHDLFSWEKYRERPLIEADATWYELFDAGVWHDQAWRDPWVFRDPDGNGFHALITARSRSGPPDRRGVLAHATSQDLLSWEVQPPIEAPRGFGQMEVPQVVQTGDGALLLFSVHETHVGEPRRRRGGTIGSGTYVVHGDTPLGPFTVPESMPMYPYTSLYSGRLVPHGGRLVFLGFIDVIDGGFVGEISDPVKFDPAMVASASEKRAPRTAR
jgi:beta-fructofuranosidase